MPCNAGIDYGNFDACTQTGREALCVYKADLVPVAGVAAKCRRCVGAAAPGRISESVDAGDRKRVFIGFRADCLGREATSVKAQNGETGFRVPDDCLAAVTDFGVGLGSPGLSATLGE